MSQSPGSRTRLRQGVAPRPEQAASPGSRSRTAAPMLAAAESPRAAQPDASTPLSEGPVPELPTTPSGGASAAPAGIAFTAFFYALFGAAALLLLGASHRLHLRPASMRPAPFLALLERPG